VLTLAPQTRRAVLAAALGGGLLAVPGWARTILEPLTIETGDGRRIGFRVERADTPAARAQGLMHREALPALHGMIFDFHTPQLVSFWMRDTPLPLDLLFLDEHGLIIAIHAMAEPFSETAIPSPAPVRAVLEINGGEAADLRLAVGDRVLHEIFAGTR
jgi:uncharacterized membrane protein (UPF0127 family)